MKRIVLSGLLLFVFTGFATPGILNDITRHLTNQDADGHIYVNHDVRVLLANDGLFNDSFKKITLSDAVKATQSTWFNKEWQHAATEEDLSKRQRIAAGNAILKRLNRTTINADKKAELIIAHGGVLPSAVKMFLAAKVAYDRQGARKLVVVNGSEPFNLDMIQKSNTQDYAKAAAILGSAYVFPTITADNKPTNGKQVAQFVHSGFKPYMPELAVEYIDKKDLTAYVQTIDKPTTVTVAASYPQLEAHVMTFALLGQKNSNFAVVAGITAGEQPDLEILYDAQTPEEKYNFERNNFARVLHRVAEYVKNK